VTPKNAIIQYIQHRALQIIAGNIRYEEACCLFNFASLANRRVVENSLGNFSQNLTFFTICYLRNETIS